MWQKENCDDYDPFGLNGWGRRHEIRFFRASWCGVSGGGIADSASRARTSVVRVRARCESLRNMRSVSATSTATGASGTAQYLDMGARRKKTDLHVAEPATARSSSPAPSLRSQRAKQYRLPMKIIFKNDRIACG